MAYILLGVTFFYSNIAGIPIGLLSGILCSPESSKRVLLWTAGTCAVGCLFLYNLEQHHQRHRDVSERRLNFRFVLGEMLSLITGLTLTWCLGHLSLVSLSWATSVFRTAMLSEIKKGLVVE